MKEMTAIFPHPGIADHIVVRGDSDLGEPEISLKAGSGSVLPQRPPGPPWP